MSFSLTAVIFDGPSPRSCHPTPRLSTSHDDLLATPILILNFHFRVIGLEDQVVVMETRYQI